MEAQEALRPCLFAIAYQMLGSVADAEDVVQSGEDGRVVWVSALEIADGVVVAVRSILNPDKLAHLRSADTRLVPAL